MKNKWFEVKNQTEKSSDLYFYGDIVSSEWAKWDDADASADDVRSFLSNVNPNTSLNIFINSGGGVVTTGLAIYNMLKRHKGYKTVYVDGLAASISSILAFSGDKLIMPKSSFMMIHLPWVGVVGNKMDLQKMIDTLETIEQSVMTVYENNLKDGVNIEDVRQMVENETWLTGEEASRIFNIELTDSVDIAASVNSDLFQKYKNVPNNLLKQPEQPKNAISAEEMAKRQQIAEEAKSNLTYLNTILGGII